MNNKKLNELFDIEAAKSVYIANAVNEALSKPEVRDWDGVEPLAVGMRVTQVGSNKGCWRIAAIGDGTCACYVGATNTLTLLATSNLKPIPQIKKIDHSSLAGSGIDCEYTNNVKETWINVYDENTDERTLVSIRLDYPMVLTEKQIKAIPDGYQKWYHNSTDWVKFDECDLGDEPFTVVKVTLKDEWEL